MSARAHRRGIQEQRARRSRQCLVETLDGRIILTAGAAPVAAALSDPVLLSTADAEHVVRPHVHPRLASENKAAAALQRSHLFALGEYLSAPSEDSPVQIARDFLASRAGELGLVSDQVEQLQVADRYSSQHTGVTHIYFRQLVDGLDLIGADVNINIAADGRVINASSNLRASAQVEPQPQPTLSAGSAWQMLAAELGHTDAARPPVLAAAQGLEQATLLAGGPLSLDDVPARLHYVSQPNGSPELAWSFVVRTGDHWYDASISAYSGELVRLDDWVAHASYHVFAWPLRHPDDGNRSTQINPHDSTASPFGWHDTDGVSGAEFTDTRGNNVFAQEDRNADDSGGSRPNGGAGLDFNFPLDLSLEPISYQDAAITNLFYWNNVLHDIHYQYGFDEVAGNFQQNNYGKGGLGGDSVLADAQDGAAEGRFNNAFFGTPPDGGQPIMMMLEFNRTSPHRDSDLENTIIVHEYGHGVSSRLTGGPSNAGALSALQSRAMGEGWSDWWSLMLSQKPADQQFDSYPIGTYVLGQSATGVGIRRQPYSFDMTVDPRIYSDFNTANESHKAGEIWGSALWDLNWLLINGDGDKILPRGFDADFYNGAGGNNLALQLVMDALKLQPANPSFLDGRDALLLADQVANSGANQRAIWTAFARRGMGFSAADGGSSSAETVVAAFDLPPALINSNSEIHGQKWSDLDGNGERDAGEPGLNGWEIQLFDGPLLVATQTTADIDVDANGTINPETERGLYRFQGLTPGVYTVVESEQPGWAQTSIARDDADAWTPLGPAPILNAETPGNTNVSGRVVAIAPHPTDTNTIFVGAAHGGVWRTVDGGVNWTPLTDDEMTLATGSMAIAPSNPDIIYVGTGEANFSADSLYGQGILKSTDGGDSWTLLGQNEFDRRTISKVVVHPTDPDTVYVAAARGVNGLAGNQGVWKSIDGGVTWTNTTAGISASVPVTDLVMDATNPDALFAGYGDVFGDTSNGLYRTTDGGTNWSPVGVGILPSGTAAGRMRLAISSSGQTVYAAWQDPGTAFGALAGLFQSIDGGTSWIDRTAATPNYLGSQGWYDHALAVDPIDPNRIYVGGAGGSNSLLRSDDGGATWTDISVGTDGSGPHANHHALALDALGNVLNGNDGGIWRSTNRGGLWDNLNTNLSLTQFYDVAVHPLDEDIAYGGTQGNGTIRFDGLAAWDHIATGDGGVVQVDFNTPEIVYHEFQYSGSGFLRRSDDSGASFNSKTTGIDTSDPGRFIIPYELDPSNPNRLVLGTNRVYQSTDRGNSWSAISPVLGAGVVAALDVAASDGNTIYTAYTDGSVFATFDGGANWVQRTTNLPGPPTSGIYSGANFGDLTGPELVPEDQPGNVGIADFAIDPSDHQTAYIVRDVFGPGRVWKTVNGGVAWSDISGNLPDLPARSIVIDPRGEVAVLYVALDRGVYRSADSGTTWELFGTGLPNTVSRDLELNLSLSRLTVGTHGRGAWTIELDDPAGLDVEKLSQVRFAEIPGGSTRANDVTGYVSPSGREYAIIGLQKGTGYVDVSDPQNPVVVAFVAGPDEPSSRPGDSTPAAGGGHSHTQAKCHDGCEGASSWRDIKTWGQHAFVTNETSGGLQVIDLTAIDNGTVTAVGTLTESGLQTAHNVGINQDSGFAFLVGTNIANGGIVAVDLADPANPEITGTWEETYIHDIELVTYTSGPFAGREIAYGFAAGLGVMVIDVTDKTNMFTVATETYPNLAYTHYGALTEDLQYLFVNDELDEVRSNVSTTTTYILDISDPGDPQYVTSFTTGLPAIDHNLRVRGDTLFEANYRSGLRVFDIGDMTDIQEIGYYDTYPADDKAHFNGAWGVYAGLPSGIVLISDIDSGLFVLDPSAALGEHLVILGPDETTAGINFGNHKLPSITLAVDTGTIDEEGGSATFTATLSAPASLTVTVDLAFSGAATLTEDYTSAADQIVIAVGETSGTATITAVQDAIAETDETVIVEIEDVTNAIEAGNQLQTTTITDDDPAPVLVGMDINGPGNTNRSAVANLTLRFDQPVMVNGASSLNVFNHTTGSPLDISAATLQNNGSSEVTWDLSGVSFPEGSYTAELPRAEAASVQGRPVGATRAFQFHVLPGDGSGDGAVGFADFSELAANFNTINGPILGPGDFDADGSVNFADFAILASNFTKTVNLLALDFGDAPETGTALPTTLGNNGARHVLGANLQLGLSVDSETDGQPDTDALGDDNVGDDEDGVTFGALQPGSNADITVAAQVPSGNTAVLNVWIDFNADGDWDDDGERVLVDRVLSNGTNSLAVAVPSGAAAGRAYARFRVTGSAGYGYDGLAPDGEVEDYRITIAAGIARRSPSLFDEDLVDQVFGDEELF